MAKTSKASIGITITGDGVDITYRPPGDPQSNPLCPQGGPIKQTLAFGYTTLTPPVGATGLLFIPPTNGVHALLMMGNVADVGFPISSNLPTLIAIPVASAPIIVKDGTGAQDVDILWF